MSNELTCEPQQTNTTHNKIVNTAFVVLMAGFILLAANGAWGLLHNPQATAVQLIKDNLRSPSSYKEISKQTIWEGNTSNRKAAYMVKIDYEAMNGFGGMNRNCKIVALWQNGIGNWSSNTELNSVPCNDNDANDASSIELLKGLNNFQ